MFTILLLTLKLAGKRGVKQLSIFETVIIIALGSAAGDPMFYEDVGIVPANDSFYYDNHFIPIGYPAYRKK